MTENSIIIKTERPEQELPSPHKGLPKQQRKMNEGIKEDDGGFGVAFPANF